MRVTLESGADSAPFKLGDVVPELWHWCYMWSLVLTSKLEPAGWYINGEFLPKIVDLPRRMWAGSRFAWMQPLRFGETYTRRSTVASIKVKEGKVGRLAFLTVTHDISLQVNGITVLKEEQDVVFRAADPGTPKRETPASGPKELGTAHWRQQWTPGMLLLFRYSALIFNSYRIHYDEPYTIAKEGFPGVVVHGPLLATLMTELVRRSIPGCRLSSFTFSAISPTYENDTITVSATAPQSGTNKIDIWITNNTSNKLACQGSCILVK
jgi:3-methylfumaryl-CoA hydratase